ncbi:glycosyltransferase family 4 protein [Azospirillum argentinense]|uniref:Glycosyltransferase family 4 protein n=1 Tax=Azospirillum argentinense TaxID=2970906 RepID=A0ABW8V8E1_9PROT
MKKLLVLNFFPAFLPPSSGGELRFHHVYAELSRHFEIDLVTWTHPDGPEERIQVTERLREHRIPKCPAFEDIHRAFHREGITGEFVGVAAALVGRTPTRYHEVVDALAAEADAIIHEFPYTLLYDRGFGRDGKPRIYNSHNFETAMVEALASGPGVDRLRRFVEGLERRLAQGSALVFATSAEERARFALEFAIPRSRLHLAPNGVDPAGVDNSGAEAAAGHLAARHPALASRIGSRPTALFIGSDHPPNLKAAAFILNELAPRLPMVHFVIAGSVRKRMAATAANVSVIGPVDHATKTALFKTASLFVNPIFQGAGTSLKALEAMAAGVPVVSTPMGVRGLPVKDDVHCIVAEHAEFADGVLRLATIKTLARDLARRAQDLVRTSFTWDRVAEGIASAIRPVLETAPRPVDRSLADRSPAGQSMIADRPLILIANDYSVREPVTGGANRIVQLSRRLARDADVVNLCLSGGEGVAVEELSPGFFEFRVPKTQAQHAFEAMTMRRNTVSVGDIASALFCNRNEPLRTLFARLGNRAAAIVFSHPYLAPLLDTTGKLRPVLYEAHNVEAKLKADLLSNHTDGAPLSAFVAALEDNTLSVANAVVAVAAGDGEEFARRAPGKPIGLVLNGAEILPPEQAAADIAARAGRNPETGFVAVFIGSDHRPNVDAARFLCTDVLPALPGMSLWVIGGVCAALDEFADQPRLKRFGTVDQDEKTRLLRHADIALNPVSMGSGSSLKASEYMAYGLPTVSTPTGVRGFDVADRRHVIIAPLEGFVKAIRDLMSDPALRQSLGEAAHRHAAQTLGWDVQADALRAVVRAAAVKSVRRSQPLRLLVVADSCTEPCRDRRDDRLRLMLDALAASGEATIDLIAPNLEEVRDQGEFGTAILPRTAPAVSAVLPFAQSATLLDCTPPASPDTPTVQALGSRLDAEAIAFGRQIIPILRQTCLLGGWYPLEQMDGRRHRWSGATAGIFARLGTRTVRLEGRLDASLYGSVQVRVNGGEPETRILRQTFTLDVELDPGVATLIELSLPDGEVEDDGPRRRGFLLERLSQRSGFDDAFESVDLALDAATITRVDHWPAFARTLRNVAADRSEDLETAFRAVHALNAPALATALEQRVADCDAMLVRWDASRMPMELLDALRRATVPVFLLLQDGFDGPSAYWPSFFEACRSAKRILTFSSADRFLFPDMGDRVAVLPGGGVDPTAFIERIAAEKAFRAARRIARPYVLLVGAASLPAPLWEAFAGLLDSVANLDILIVDQAANRTADVDPDALRACGDRIRALTDLDRTAFIGALTGAVATVVLDDASAPAILDSWMAGRPVIVTGRCLTGLDLVTNGTNGIVAETPTALADTIALLAANPVEAGRMGLAGHREALGRHSWNHAAVWLRDLLGTDTISRKIPVQA